MKTTRLLLVASVLCLSGALADEHEPAKSSDAEQPTNEERVCFNRRQVNSFDGLSDRHVYIKEGVNDFYLLTMRNRCTGLRDARGIGIKDTMGRICSNSFAEIIFSDMGRVQRCRIGTVERVQNKDEAKALVAEREDYEKRKKKDKD